MSLFPNKAKISHSLLHLFTRADYLRDFDYQMKFLLLHTFIWLNIFVQNTFATDIDISTETSYAFDLADGTDSKEPPWESAISKPWISVNSNINLGYNASPFWVKIDVKRSTQTSLLLEVANPRVNRIEYYVVTNRLVVQEGKTGSFIPIAEREIPHRNFLLPIDNVGTDKFTIYLKVQSDYTLRLPISLQTTKYFEEKDRYRLVFHAGYIGCILGLAFYNLFIYVAIRDKSYIYYVLFISSFLTLMLLDKGLMYQFLWPDYSALDSQLYLLLLCVSPGLSSVFTIEFLSLKRYLPVFYKLLYFIACLWAGLAVLSLVIPADDLIILFIALFIPASFIFVATAIIAWIKRVPGSFFYFLSWLVLIHGVFIYILSWTGITPYNNYAEYVSQVSNIFEAIFLSLAIANRIHRMKQDTLNAQEEAIKNHRISVENLIKAEVLKKDFLTVISHELRTPMSAVMGGLQIVQEHPTVDFKSSLDLVKNGADDLMKLIDDILIYTEIQAGVTKIIRNPEYIELLFISLSKKYKNLCTKKGISFEWTHNSRKGVGVDIDKEKLTILLEKLLDNAVRFTEEGTVIATSEIREYQGGVTLIITIEDTGLGIDEDSLKTIFDSFTQSHTGFQRRYGGLGIGLAICSNFIREMDGDITVKSVIGKGSIFKIMLPTTYCELPISVTKKALLIKNVSILVVEDNEINQKILIKMLTKMGFTCSVACHGEEALEILSHKVFGLVLMDLQMPVMDGFSCTEAIRKSTKWYKDIPIIAVTANILDADKEHCLTVGMNDFLKKPIKISTLKVALQEFVSLDT